MKTCDGNVGRVLLNRYGNFELVEKYKVPYDEIYFENPGLIFILMITH